MRIDESIDRAPDRADALPARRLASRRDPVEPIALDKRWSPAVRLAVIAVGSVLVWAIVIAAALLAWRFAG